MSEVRTFFRHCPYCKRRFEIRLVGKKLVGTKADETETAEYTTIAPGVPMVLESDVPLIHGVEDFSYTYKCKHCGHQWSEERFREFNARIDKEELD